MPTALNMTLKIKQDDATKQALADLKKDFAAQVQPAIDAALGESQLVHYARVVVIDDLYIQVLTEFDGDPFAYTEFFRQKLPTVFKAIFSLAEGVPEWDELNIPNTFYKYAGGANLPSLGQNADPDSDNGYLFDAFNGTTVKQIQETLKVGPAPLPSA